MGLGIGSRVRHPAYGNGVVIRLHKMAYDVCFMLYGIKQIGREYEAWEIVDAIPSEETTSFSDAEQSLLRILRTYNALTEEVPLGERWENGTLILKPGEEGRQSKEMAIDVFFHKIVMVRDRLRVMEQRVNASKNLSDEEKINLQQYITRIYGSLTSFNVLFKHKEDHFVGERSGK
ncbi:MAG: hypothetical protein HRU40_08600 [Saprospiraceae bacterium]|nr:hypothetical protein [Saprospiraceae bacterium]